MLKKAANRLLIIDDDVDLRNLLVKRFQKSDLLIDEASNVVEAKKKLYNQTYDIIILDLVMEPESGYTLFELLKEDPKLKWIPLIVLSGSDDIEDKVRCLELGADDYVTKPFNFKELNARVKRLLARIQEFEQLAYRDGLTGVFNRRYFDTQFAAELQRVKRIPASMTLTIIDIDHFKLINDTYGHPVGDQVLQSLSDFLKQRLRETDLLFRYGGEEFVVLLLDTPGGEAKNVIARILDEIRGYTLVTVGTQSLHVTFSAGVVEWRTGMSGNEWITQTDQMLYKAKESGRNVVMS